MTPTCDIYQLALAGKPFRPMEEHTLMAVITAIFANMQSLTVDDAVTMAIPFNTFSTKELLAMLVALMCPLAGALGAGQGCVITGDTDPVDPPASGCTAAIYYREDVGSTWLWQNNTLTWFQLTGPLL